MDRKEICAYIVCMCPGKKEGHRTYKFIAEQNKSKQSDDDDGWILSNFLSFLFVPWAKFSVSHFSVWATFIALSLISNLPSLNWYLSFIRRLDRLLMAYAICTQTNNTLFWWYGVYSVNYSWFRHIFEAWQEDFVEQCSDRVQKNT